MARRRLTALVALAAVTGVVWLAPVGVTAQTVPSRFVPGADASTDGGQAQAEAWTLPRTPWGVPDLQGIWDYATLTPLQRPREFAGKEFLTDEEVAALEQRKAERADGRPIWSSAAAPTVHPAFWLDYGTEVVKTRRTSLIVDPPDGRIPPLTPEAQTRAEARRAHRREHPADSWEDRNLFERCLTLGVPRLPGAYNNLYQILQTAGYVVILNEMIHETRIVPMDSRPHLGPHIRQWLGDSRGRWENDTLVVETTNFSGQAPFRGSGANLHLVERFRRVDAETISYEFTIDDPTTFTRPWTVTLPLTKTEGPMYEYACHEGNYDLANILRTQRAEEQAAADAARPR